MDRTKFMEAMKQQKDRVDCDMVKEFLSKQQKNRPNEVPFGWYSMLNSAEEMMEFGKEMIKYIRGKGDRNDFVQELADAYLSMEYAKHAAGITDEEFFRAINVKLQYTLDGYSPDGVRQ